jgi:peptide/nickel transport system substrate-binding protein
MRSIRTALVLSLLVMAFAVPLQAQGKSMTVSWLQEPDNLNPLYTSMTFAGYTYQLFLAPAWNFDNDLNPTPVLVSEMPSLENGGISEDGTTFTLNLKDGMTWSDGDPLDSADFLFTYEMTMAEGNAVSSRFPYDQMLSVEAPDALTVVFSFAEPYAPWATLWTTILPEHVLRPVFDAEGTIDNADYNRNPTVGSGPYNFESWEVGSFMRFVANPAYVLGTPKIDTVIVTFVTDDVAYVATLISGDADLGTFVAYSDVPSLEDAGLNVQVLPSGYNEGWFLNNSPELAHPAMSDVRVRKAVAMAFNRDQFNVDLNYSATFTPSSFWENTPYDNPDLTPYAFDPAGASALLDEAGWIDSNGDGTRDKDGVELVLRYSTTDAQWRQNVQAVVAQQLQEVGIGIVQEAYPATEFFGSWANNGTNASGNYDIGQYANNTALTNPANVTVIEGLNCEQRVSEANPGGQNYTGFCSEEMDAAAEVTISSLDADERQAAANTIQQIMRDEVPLINLFPRGDNYAYNTSRFTGELTIASGVGNTWFDILNWELAS